MNAALLALELVLLASGFVIWRRSKQSKARHGTATAGIILISIGAMGIIVFAINFIRFLFVP